jgi:hypothetical protein
VVLDRLHVAGWEAAPATGVRTADAIILKSSGKPAILRVILARCASSLIKQRQHRQ